MGRTDDATPYLTRVRVISVGPEYPGSAIWEGLGVTEEGRRVRFYGSPVCSYIYDALEQGNIAMVDLEPQEIMASLDN